MTRTPAERLVLKLPPDLLEGPLDVPLVGGDPRGDPVEEAVRFCAQIIRGRLFGEKSAAVGYECMRMLLEDDPPWPEELAEEIDRAVKAFEAAEIDEAKLLEWVYTWIAQAEGRRDKPGGGPTA